MKEKRYYWLKLEENYFDLKVQKALRKLPSGSEMLICYLKMQLKYLNKAGLIEYQGIYESLAEEIALDIDEKIDIVKMTISMLIKWNVIEQEENNLYLAEMQNRIGSKTDTAIRVAKHREKLKMLQCNTDVTKCNSIKEIEIDKEKDIEIDIEKNNTLIDFIETNFGRTLNPIEVELIMQWEDNDLTRYAIKQAILNGAYNFKYINTILNSYKMNNITTVQQAQEENERFLNKKGKIKETKPEWFNQNVIEEQPSNDEINNLEERLKRYK